MSLFSAVMAIILVSSVTVFLVSINRLLAYNRKYRLPESKYTKLFKVISKEHTAMAYCAMVVGHALLTVWFLIKL